ncbi:MAG: hypothetical protein HY873_06175 [Chloroflexi bacterium]|nr:hypothetical protein [Chloroflexota bacterium]
MPVAFELVRDPRGSVVHVRKADGECIGCVEAGLFEVLKALILAEEESRRERDGVGEDRRSGNGSPSACRSSSVTIASHSSAHSAQTRNGNAGVGIVRGITRSR